MHKEFLMGNEAIALGALAAGVGVFSGYPGTPSTEVLETVSLRAGDDIYVEWSINEKAAMEVAAGAAYAGERTLVTMKQVGLNVASDPLMSLSYIGVKGGMVVLVADDPGPISSQTEQDTRTFGMYSKLPVFDPSSVQEAYDMIQEAFDFSEKYKTPVLFRPTTRIDHGYASISIKDENEYHKTNPEGFIKDPSKWVIFPRLSFMNHGRIEKRNQDLTAVFSDYDKNVYFKAKGTYSDSRIGIVSHGISFAHVMDNLSETDRPRVLKVATPFPFPEELCEKFMEGLDEIYVIEELDPCLERAILMLCGKRGVPKTVHGKLTGDVKSAGENTTTEIADLLKKIYGKKVLKSGADTEENKEELPALPVRPPVLCTGCPHRASFYAVKQAMKGKKTIFCGDIGCYTLGNAKPLDMCDTCLCMGAGLGISQGVWHVEPDTKAFAFVGDSTFFASGISGAINGYYNQADMTLCILDNSTTAMTGHQPHPGTGRTLMGEVVEKVDMEHVLRGIGIETVECVNPLDHDEAVETVKRVADEKGIKAIIFRYPCIVKWKPKTAKAKVDEDKCISCKKCINELGCPALILKNGKAFIDNSLCTGCTLCEQICPVGAIGGGGARKPESLLNSQKEATKEVTSKNTDKKADSKNPDNKTEKIEKSPLKNIVLSGVGGQGTILASKLIANTAMRKGLSIQTAETIGMAQRGGSVFSHVRLGDGAFSPLIGDKNADLIIGFEPAEAVRMLPYLKEGGTVVTSIRPIMPVSAMIGASEYDVDKIIEYLKSHVSNLILVDADKALEEIGNDKVLNVLLLGAAAKTEELGLTREDIMQTIKEKMPEKLHEVNSRALFYENIE